MGTTSAANVENVKGQLAEAVNVATDAISYLGEARRILRDAAEHGATPTMAVRFAECVEQANRAVVELGKYQQTLGEFPARPERNAGVAEPLRAVVNSICPTGGAA